MKTINHEYYVSLEVAKLLREAGFDWECREYYYNFTTTGWSLSFDDDFVNWNSWSEQYISAPTLDVAQRWLREVKGFEVTIDWSVIVNAKLVNFNERIYNYHVESDDYADGDNEFVSYEQAQEAGIKEALEIILEK